MFEVIPNKEGINEITIPIDVHCICAIGKETYTNQTTIILKNPEAYPEYIGFKDWIFETYEDKAFNIESYVSDLTQVLVKNCKGEVTVTSYVDDARKHFPVTVSKTLKA